MLSFAGTGECITCGDNRHGQLGYRRERECVEQGRERQPAVVPGLAGKEVERVTCGDLFIIACCKGIIYCNNITLAIAAVEVDMYTPLKHNPVIKTQFCSTSQLQCTIPYLVVIIIMHVVH